MLYQIFFLFVLSSFSAIFYLHFSRVTGFSRISLVIRFVRIILLSFISSRLCSSELHFGLSLYFGFSINFVIFSTSLLTQYHSMNTIRYFSLLFQIRIKIILQQILSINYFQLMASFRILRMQIFRGLHPNPAPYAPQARPTLATLMRRSRDPPTTL